MSLLTITDKKVSCDELNSDNKPILIFIIYFYNIYSVTYLLTYFIIKIDISQTYAYELLEPDFKEGLVFSSKTHQGSRFCRILSFRNWLKISEHNTCQKV